MDKVDCILIGAGVVGLAMAARLAAAGREVIVLEQHDLIGSETSSRNSEVIHAGIYYPTNSLKAELCVRGKHLLYEYAQEFHIPHRNCGKIIVAADDSQVDTVRSYIDKGHANQVPDLHWLSQAEVAELEPEVRCVGAVMSPSTGIIDSHSFMLSLQGELERHGGMIAFNSPVIRCEFNPLTVHTDALSLRADLVINSAGLWAPDLVAGLPGAPQAHYAKGHYYAYAGAQPFTRLVYPIAVAGGLGVHVTLDLAGQVKFGPDVHWLEAIDYSFDETIKPLFAAAIRRYFPALDDARLHPSYTGIRPKIASSADGFRDFRIDTASEHGVTGLVNLLGIESPGLTASLAIAEYVSARI
ncbi:MAG: NAD(P)/FAD-dependent oxidoreductase [Pseudomonadota bacterium]